MSNGRVEFGVGRGFVEYDYERLHVPRDGSNERMREELEIILKAWTGEAFEHRGKFYQYEALEVWPRPEQRPHPPIWVSCSRTPSSFEWAGQRGFNVLTVAYHSVENLVAMNRLYREAWDKAGHPKGKWNLAAHYHVVLSENKHEAREIARNAWRRYIEATTHTSERLGKTATGVIAENRRNMMEDLLDTDRMVAELRQIACTPDECVELLEKAQDRMGFTQCDCTFFFGGINYEQAQRSLRLFAKEVMPKLRNREPRLST